MEAILVTAHTSAGFASSDPWSPSLDGILAYWVLREQLGEEEFALGMTGQAAMVTAELPLQRILHGDWWWWAASSPVYERRAEYLHYYHRRFDDAAAQRFMRSDAARVLTSAGPFKSYRQTHRVMLTPWVRWHAVGDAREVRRLLSRCTAIGAGSTRGVGRVVRWEVSTEGADADLAWRARPLPAEYATENGIGGPLLDWGIRPPGRLRENRTLCVMP